MTSLGLKLFRGCMMIAVSLGGVSNASARQDIPQPIIRPRGAPGGSISGKVVLPSGHPVNDRVRITLSSPEDPGALVYTDNNGGFSFNNLPEGTYTVEVLADRKLYEPVSENVRLIRSSRVNLMIYLKEKSKTPSSTGNVVSAAETDQQVPAPAKQEYAQATRLVNEGKIKEAIERMKKALAIYPNYLAARNDLGVQYLKLSRFDEATEQFEAAIEINPKAFNPRLNLGIVLIKLKRYNDAKEHLALAVAIDSSTPASHLYLGIAGVETDDLEVAERELATAVSQGGREYSVAHYHLARVSMKRGVRDEAIRELKSFLETAPTGEEAVRAKQLLESLQQ